LIRKNRSRLLQQESLEQGVLLVQSRKGKIIPAIATATMVLGIVPACQAGSFMDSQWADTLCQDWNQSETLTTELVGDRWIGNSGDKGYKVIQMYRDECGPESRVELQVTEKDGKAICTYGGPAKTKQLDESVDYLMHATDEHWTCMGEGRFGCGAMGAMMSGKLQFAGPKMEAADVVEPFNAFLQLTAEPEGNTSCPAATTASN